MYIVFFFKIESALTSGSSVYLRRYAECFILGWCGAAAIVAVVVGAFQWN